MPSFETICQQIFTDRRFFRKFLIGGLLSFIPLVNLIVLGYLYSYSRSISSKGSFVLPEWKDFSVLIVDGVKAFLVLLPFALICAGGGWVLSWILHLLFESIGLSLFAMTLAWLPFTLGLWVSVPLGLTALLMFQETEDWQELKNATMMARFIRLSWPRLLLPTLAFGGLMLLGYPLWGFAGFLGMGCLISYYNAVFLVVFRKSA